MKMKNAGWSQKHGVLVGIILGSMWAAGIAHAAYSCSVSCLSKYNTCVQSAYRVENSCESRCGKNNQCRTSCVNQYYQATNACTYSSDACNASCFGW